jgi:RES domain-containing protein
VDVDAIHVSATWWRHVPVGGDPWYEPDDPADGRWQRGEIVDAWYLADEPDTVWAEWYRAVADLGVPPMHLLPRDLWAWEISLLRVADLSSEARLARVGLQHPRPNRAHWPAFQAVGERLCSEGYQGLIAPSAARPDHAVLCVFRTEREMPGATPVPPPETVKKPPRVPKGMTT